MNNAALDLPKLALCHVKRAIKTGIKHAQKVSVNALQETSTNTAILSALTEMEKEGSLNVDLCPYRRFTGVLLGRAKAGAEGQGGYLEQILWLYDWEEVCDKKNSNGRKEKAHYGEEEKSVSNKAGRALVTTLYRSVGLRAASGRVA